MSNAINPKHPMVQALDGQWMKIVALLLHKHKLSGTQITIEDFVAMEKDFPSQPGKMAVVVAHGKGEVIELSLKCEREAREMAATQGGWPQ
jgi:hypothetical protein